MLEAGKAQAGAKEKAEDRGDKWDLEAQSLLALPLPELSKRTLQYPRCRG